MSSITVNHEYKEIGTLCLISGCNLNNGTPESSFDHFFSDNKDSKKSYWLRVNFEHVSTGATYCANFDDGQIRGFCAILKFDPELLNDFMTNKPDVKIQQENIIIEFNLQVVSKVYSFNIQIPKYIPTGSPTEVVELRQQNNVLIRRIKTLEDKVTNIELMNAKLYINTMYAGRPLRTDDKLIMEQCFELCGEEPFWFDTMINDITYNHSSYSYGFSKSEMIVELLKKGKMPQLKQYIIDNKKQNNIYKLLIHNSNNMHEYVSRIDLLLNFCQVEIKIDYKYAGNDMYCNKEGRCTYIYMGNSNIIKKYSSLLEDFDFHSFTYHINVLDNKNCCDTTKKNIQELLNSPDFLRKRTEIRKLIIKIQT